MDPAEFKLLFAPIEAFQLSATLNFPKQIFMSRWEFSLELCDFCQLSCSLMGVWPRFNDSRWKFDSRQLEESRALEMNSTTKSF